MQREAYARIALAAALVIGVTLATDRTGSAQEEPTCPGAEGCPTCAPAGHPGGDWPRYGQNDRNTRHQKAESVIGPENVGTLTKAWSFSLAEDETGPIYGEVVVAEGCAYFGTWSGHVYALNADTGELVWKERIAPAEGGGSRDLTLFTPNVHDGVVYNSVSRRVGTPDPISDRNGSFVSARDAHTGRRIWDSPEVATESDSYTNSSAVYHNGVVWLGISASEQEGNRSGGFAIVDASDGSVLVRTRSVPAEEFAIRGDGGGAIWSTAAVDENGFGYASTGQPSPYWSLQSDHSNAVIKFDLARARDADGNEIPYDGTNPNPDFGKIVGSFWGTMDLGQDVEFGGSPTLYTDDAGNPMVAAFQKTGRLHAGRTANMSHAWEFPLAPAGYLLSNYTSVANDGTNIYGHGGVIGQLWSLDATGSVAVPNWVTVVPDSRTAMNPVGIANGVVYYANEADALLAYDAATGAELLNRSIGDDLGMSCTNAGPGITIARNTVFGVCGTGQLLGPPSNRSGGIVAYRLPSGP